MNAIQPSGVIDLPVGEYPGWEQDHDEDINSLYDSCVLAHSLKQSREHWLRHTFPRFSGKPRGSRVAELHPPRHAIQTRGKCNLEIGPHIFPGTIFYEVHYLPPPQSLQTPTYAYSVPANPTTSRQPITSQNISASSTPASTALDNSSAPLISSLNTVTTITPSLISQVNSAASSNPILANLLQLAAAGNASPDQLKTLGLFIQTLTANENATSLSSSPDISQQRSHINSPSAGYSQTTAAPVKPFDIVFEFREMPSERWIFPRGPCTCEKVLDRHFLETSFDILLSTAVPFTPNTENSSTPHKEIIPQQVTTFRLRNSQEVLWDTFSRWIGGEQNIMENRAILSKLVPTKRVFLGYRLTTGSLLSQLQMAATQYPMKTLKQGPNTANSRTSRSKRSNRKSTLQPVSEQKRRRPATATEVSAPLKRRQAATGRSTFSAQISCLSCKQTDVPLIRGGYCRPCVNSEKTGSEGIQQNTFPQVPHGPTVQAADK